MAIYQDQTGRTVEISDRPQRIVSLVPSITELVCDLGGENSLVGVTRFCVHPDHIRNSTIRIGGTKDPKLEKIRALAPDLILASKEENVKEQVLTLAEEFPVWVSDVSTFEDALRLIDFLGNVQEAHTEATELRNQIESGYAQFKIKSNPGETKSALYLIWKDPYMAAGTDTFISSMMHKVGLRNVVDSLGKEGVRYPRLSMSDIESLAPDFILLSSEPYPFRFDHIESLKRYAQQSVLLVNGEAFSWYGSRMLHDLPYLLNFRRSLLEDI